jgi:hypothetical protein
MAAPRRSLITSRVNVCITDNTRDKIKSIQNLLDTGSREEAVRRAVRFYEYALSLSERGYTLKAMGPNGLTVVLVPLQS